MTKSRKHTKAQRRAKELHNMARRAVRKVRMANAMLLGADHLRTFGLFRVETQDSGLRFYTYYDHNTLEELSDSEVGYRMRNSYNGR